MTEARTRARPVLPANPIPCTASLCQSQCVSVCTWQVCVHMQACVPAQACVCAHAGICLCVRAHAGV